MQEAIWCKTAKSNVQDALLLMTPRDKGAAESSFIYPFKLCVLLLDELLRAISIIWCSAGAVQSVLFKVILLETISCCDQIVYVL